MPRAPARSPPPPAPPGPHCPGTAPRTAGPPPRAPASTGRARYRPSRAGRSPPRLLRRGRAGGARRRFVPDTPERIGAGRSFRRDAERQEVLVAEKILAFFQLQPGRLGVADHLFRVDALFQRRARAGGVAILLVVDDTDHALRLERLREIPEKRDGLFHLVVRIDDQHGIQ